MLAIFEQSSIINTLNMEVSALNTINELHIDNGINIFDGYRSEKIWTLPENYSTYRSEEIEDQCTIPGSTLEDIWKKLGRI